MAKSLVLHGYWRSTASYRTRIALNLKGLAYDQVTHDLRTGAQRQSDYLSINPQGLVPSLEANGQVMTQSQAVLEWLEEQYPVPPLLPKDKTERAFIRAMVATVCCDMHPLNNLRVLKVLRSRFGAEPEQLNAWAAEWLAPGFAALDEMIGRTAGRFAFGDDPTLADCCLAPQVYSARRFNFDMAPYPQVLRVVETALDLPEVQAAHPDRQPDADTP